LGEDGPEALTWTAFAPDQPHRVGARSAPTTVFGEMELVVGAAGPRARRRLAEQGAASHLGYGRYGRVLDAALGGDGVEALLDVVRPTDDLDAVLLKNVCLYRRG
jgi:hypothetical protein